MQLYIHITTIPKPSVRYPSPTPSRLLTLANEVGDAVNPGSSPPDYSPSVRDALQYTLGHGPLYDTLNMNSPWSRDLGMCFDIMFGM